MSKTLRNKVALSISHQNLINTGHADYITINIKHLELQHTQDILFHKI